jgi:hypothetical protein
VNAVQLRVRSKIHPDELEAKRGKVLAEDDYNVKLTGPTDVYGPDGKLFAKYMPGALKPLMEASYETLHSLKTLETNNRGLASGTPRMGSVAGSRWNYAAPVKSAILGAFDPKTPRNYCRLTAWTGREAERFGGLVPLFQAIGEHFRAEVPDRYAAQERFIGKTHPDWVIAGTPFTTITVNNSYPTGVHTDKGDLEEGFSNLAVLRRGDYRGGVFVFTEFRVGVDMQDGDLLLMDAHQWHGNTAMFCNVCNDRIGPGGTENHDVACGTERISIVCYYRTRMTQCGSAEEEVAKAQEWAEKRADWSADSNPLIEQMAEEAAEAAAPGG